MPQIKYRMHSIFYGLGIAGCLAGCASLPMPQELTPTPLASVPSPTPTPALRPICLVAGGDVLPGCHLDPYLRQHGMDYPFTGIAPVLQAADIGLVNLECPLSLRGQRHANKTFTFRAHPDAAPALRRAGINAVALGNNHILDFGPQALEDTLQALTVAGIAYAGAGSNTAAARTPACISLPDGRQVAVLSYSLTYPSDFWAGLNRAGTALARFPYVEADIRSATAWADWVVVCFHWGGELKTMPKPYQCEYGHAAIEAGAHLVVGSHPHVLQGMEWYRHGLILYSLGNLAFGGGKSRRATRSALVKVHLGPEPGLLSAWVLPLTVDNLRTEFIPAPLDPQQSIQVLNDLSGYSRPWGTRYIPLPDASGWAQILPPLDPASAGNEPLP